MANRYHISPRTGRPVVCKAKIKCPFGDLERDHYASRAEAEQAFESLMSTQLFASYRPGEMKVTPLDKSLRKHKDSIIVPKGVYALGDPLFTAGTDSLSWDRWNSYAKVEAGDGMLVGAEFNSHPVIASKTAVGAGEFMDNFGRVYNCESGTIGLVPMTLATRMGLLKEDILDSSQVISFDEPTEVYYEDGFVYFGGVLKIYTDVNFNEVITLDDLDLLELEDDDLDLVDGDFSEFNDSSQ